jgi:hypothetical protein
MNMHATNKNKPKIKASNKIYKTTNNNKIYKKTTNNNKNDTTNNKTNKTTNNQINETTRRTRQKEKSSAGRRTETAVTTHGEARGTMDKEASGTAHNEKTRKWQALPGTPQRRSIQPGEESTNKAATGARVGEHIVAATAHAKDQRATRLPWYHDRKQQTKGRSAGWARI